MDKPIPGPFIDVILTMHDLIDKCKDDEEFKEVIDEFRGFVSRLAWYFYSKTGNNVFIGENDYVGDDRRAFSGREDRRGDWVEPTC